MIRAGVRLYKWCQECDRVTEHGEQDVFDCTIRFCREHSNEPWESIYCHKLPPVMEVNFGPFPWEEARRDSFIDLIRNKS